MLEKVKDFISPYTDAVKEFIEPGINSIIEFLSKDLGVIYVSIAIVLLIVLISGLVTCFRKFPKLFLAIIVVLSIICAVCYFLVYK